MDAPSLADQQCRPLSGVSSQLPLDIVAKAMPELPGWELAEECQALVKTFHFEDYYRTLAFVNALAFVAHEQDHHPDLSVHYNRCVVRYSTHDAGGLTANDLISAAKAERLFSN